MPDLPDTDAFRRALLDFYDAIARPLPWRGTRDPYAIWVSEVMAQQTRVETVVPYYLRWLERYPTVEALARAPLDDVLKSWEGLGYYSRARNLHRAAGVVSDDHDGVVPDSVEGLKALPGVGDYTAGAIASIAFERPVPAVDGNVRRVYARLVADPAPSDGDLRRWAAGVVDPQRPGDFNQALMELGALVCTPRNPNCAACPVAGHCAALEAGTVDEMPAPKRRAAVRREVRAVGVFARGGQVLVRRRPDEGLLAGLWELPSVTVAGEAHEGAVEAAVRALGAGLGLALDAEAGRTLDPVPHLFSHLHVTYRPCLVGVAEGRAAPELAEGESLRWIDPADPGGLALPVAQQKVLAGAATGPLRRRPPAPPRRASPSGAWRP